MIEGIDISKDDAEKQVVPEDLNSLAVGSYIIPNPKRRKLYGFVLIVTGLLSQIVFSLTGWLSVSSGSSLIVMFGLFILLIDNSVNIKQNEVIKNIENNVPHSIGYYSIALTFELINSFKFLKPIWTVIVYDHKNPPTKKTIIEIDAANGDLVSEVYTESIQNA